MSDEFGTVNVRRGDRAREIEILRQQYRRHRESLVSMAAEAPTEALSAAYDHLIQEIDQSLRKLDDLEGRVPQDTQPVIQIDAAGRPISTLTAGGLAAAAAAAAQNEATFRSRPTEPGARPLVNGPQSFEAAAPEAADPNPVPRLVLIVAAGIVVLGIIFWLLWKASGDRRAPAVVQQTDTAVSAAAPDTVAPVTPAPRPAAASLAITPAAQDYGTIRKGTRAVRQFQVTNTTSKPIAVQVTRSTCRCLYYDYVDKLAPGKQETITVTIDGAKARAGNLHEALTVSAKKDPSITASFEVNAVIK